MQRRLKDTLERIATVIDGFRSDPFSSIGPYSDDPEYGALVLDGMQGEVATLGAFRTAILRGVGQRVYFGHRGHRETLRSFLDDVYDRPRLQDSAVGALDPKVRGVDLDDIGEMIAFLQTLDCPPLQPELAEP